MKASIRELCVENPSGLFQMRPSLTIPEYRDNYGFGLNHVCTIYESKRSHHSGKDWFSFPNKRNLEELFRVKEESMGDLLIVYIVETIKSNRVYCNLVLSDKSFSEIMNDKSQYILKVHQMYSMYIKNNDLTFSEAF